MTVFCHCFTRMGLMPSSRSSRAITCVPFPSSTNLWKIRRTTFAPSSLIYILPSFTSYPSILRPNTTPCSIRRFCPHLTRSEVFLLSSCAIEDIIASRSSASPSKVLILSFRKMTPTPCFFRSRV